MKRTTIFIDEAVEQDLRLLARRRARPMAALVREALATYVTEHRRTSSDLPAFVAADGSGHRDTAEHHEDILFEDLQPHPPAVPVAKRRRRPALQR
jgi:predicted transcriptional regulator